MLPVLVLSTSEAFSSFSLSPGATFGHSGLEGMGRAEIHTSDGADSVGARLAKSLRCAFAFAGRLGVRSTSLNPFQQRDV